MRSWRLAGVVVAVVLLALTAWATFVGFDVEQADEGSRQVDHLHRQLTPIGGGLLLTAEVLILVALLRRRAD